MRRRVLHALRSASDDKPSAQPHERTAFDLARAVIARDRAHDWQLLAQPQRLRIDTLDAFNAWLARQLPVLADGVAAADVVDKPDDLYREAARRCVAGVAGDDAPLARALAHAAARRRQRLRPARAAARGAAAAARSVAAPAARRSRRASAAARGRAAAARRRRARGRGRLAGVVEPPLLAALAPLLRHAAGAASDSLRTTLAPWLALEQPPPSGAVALAAWRGIAALLLTKQGEWRKRVAKAGRVRARARGAARPAARAARRAAAARAAACGAARPSARCPTRATRSSNGRVSRRCKSCSCGSRPSSRSRSRSAAPSTSSSSRSPRSARSARSTRRRSCCSRSIAGFSICSSTSFRTRRNRSAGCSSS